MAMTWHACMVAVFFFCLKVPSYVCVGASARQTVALKEARHSIMISIRLKNSCHNLKKTVQQL